MSSSVPSAVRSFGKKLAVAALRAYKARRIDDYQNKEARKAYDIITGQRPDRVLSASVRRRISDYAGDVLGSVSFAPWLEAYTAFRGEFREGWLPDNYIERYLAPHSAGRFRSLGVRSLANRILQTDLLPDLVYGVNGGLYDRNYEPIEPADLARHVFAASDAAFLKLEGSVRGYGVTRLEAGSFSPDLLPKNRDFVIQEAVRQHPAFDELSPDAAATLRLTTVKQPGRKAEVRTGLLRLGIGGMQVVQVGKSVSVPVIDFGTGATASFAIRSKFVTVDRHPDTGAEFGGRTVPEFARAVAACTSLHDRLPHIWYIGWDVGITETGAVKLFEFNIGHAGVRFSEAAVGPCFLGLGWDRLHLREPPDIPYEITLPGAQAVPPASPHAV